VTAAKAVHEAWLDVMEAVQSIGKHERNTQQNFAFRGIDATLNAVGPALRDARVFVRPRRVVSRDEERYETRGGASMRNVTLTIEWEITGPAGDSFLAETVGEAADAGDKAVSKAHSVAYRTLLLQALCVPTGDRDPDADAHERAAVRRQRPRKDWRAELTTRSTVEAVQALWREAVAEGEMTEDLAGAMTARSDELKKQATDDDPWTTPARNVTELPLPDTDDEGNGAA
jgi:hypothetical protein